MIYNRVALICKITDTLAMKITDSDTGTDSCSFPT